MADEPSGLWPALLAIQNEAPTLQKSALNPHFTSKYVPLDKLHEVVIPLINKRGLVWITTPTLLTENGTPCLGYELRHVESGEHIDGLMPLMLDKQNPQGQGSAITYARRYALMAVLGLVADEDDDGNKASGTRKRAASKSKAKDAPATGGGFGALLPANDKPLNA